MLAVRVCCLLACMCMCECVLLLFVCVLCVSACVRTSCLSARAHEFVFISFFVSVVFYFVVSCECL